jgi:hypothetical protein
MEITDNGAPTGAERTCTAGIDGDDEDGLYMHAQHSTWCGYDRDDHAVQAHVSLYQVPLQVEVPAPRFSLLKQGSKNRMVA